jgi:hypothetical protein
LPDQVLISITGSELVQSHQLDITNPRFQAMLTRDLIARGVLGIF